MAINKITAPLSTPDNFASPVINQLASILNAFGYNKQFSDGYVKKGALFSIGGSMYLADANTEISGTTSKYVMLTVSGDTATASYATDLTDVSWNGSYSGYYDDDGNLYIFDELAAYEAGEISEFMREYAPIKYMRSGTTNGIDCKTVKGIDLASVFTNGSPGAYGSKSIALYGSWIIPAGLYMFVSTGSDYSPELQVKTDSGSWTGGNPSAGLVLSDGVHYRISNPSTSIAQEVYYRKLL